MKLEKLISIRVYDGNKTLNQSLKIFLHDVLKHANLRLRIGWQQAAAMEKLSSGTCLMLLLGDQVCGIVDYHVQYLHSRPQSLPSLHETGAVWISDFIIHPAYRRIGLGKMLMDTVVNYSRYLGKTKLRILPTEGLPELYGFLHAYGFTERHRKESKHQYYQLSLHKNLQLAGNQIIQMQTPELMDCQ
ncbi:GNAT family N-acetyltransferase [Pedobacter sp. MC2016-05]|uniref:GNAT family N-acetyltransferase n=1 Tax=Pedobacter sp. MC2016-05 TaxID=2994474 RepID=UPI0022477DEC|nr:GNAT family N-acetyltransferase [Pedobacter sp. MC2016-05]MCX2476069.1 GNAT family N-acetyltransferase [Pedobacter sp. MC2016-05]